MDEDDVRRDDPATDNTTDHPTPDDALEPADDIYNPTRDEETLSEDGDSPATPAPDSPAERPLPADDPQLDYDRDAHETYDAGNGTASGAFDDEELQHDRPEPLEPED